MSNIWDALTPDPGGEMPPTRVRILALRAAEDINAPHALPLLNALDALEAVRATLAAHEADVALYARVLREVPWLGAWPGIYGTWPPAWLVELVAQGRADAIQADRAAVTGAENLGGVPTVSWTASRPWYRHSVPPQGHDPLGYASARRVLAACRGEAP